MEERVSVDGDTFGGGVSFLWRENFYEGGDSNTNKKGFPPKKTFG